MPTKRCLVKYCKAVDCAKRIFRIPSLDVVGQEIWNTWMNNVDKDRTNHGDPYGICSRHFAGILRFYI